MMSDLDRQQQQQHQATYRTVPHCQVYANQEARISEIRPMHGKSRPDRIWRCGRGRRWRVMGGFSRDGDDDVVVVVVVVVVVQYMLLLLLLLLFSIRARSFTLY